jgi:hypothetical protein
LTLIEIADSLKTNRNFGAEGGEGMTLANADRNMPTAITKGA